MKLLFFSRIQVKIKFKVLGKNHAALLLIINVLFYSVKSSLRAALHNLLFLQFCTQPYTQSVLTFIVLFLSIECLFLKCLLNID